MIDRITQRLRDAAVFASIPSLPRKLHQAQNSGLHTLLDYQRLAMLVAAVRKTADLQGDVIEFGTFRGGSAGVLLQEMRPDKTLHVCDSFQGMPDVSVQDNFHKKGDFAETNDATVRAGLEDLGPNFEMHVGYFDRTIKELEKREMRFSFAHIDVDLYESVRDCLEFSYPRMVDGGIIILDDYDAPTCLGGRRAADEFFESKVETLVPLSYPSNAVVVGGGNAFEILTTCCGFPAGSFIFRTRVFKHTQS